MKKIFLLLICLFINSEVYAYYSSDPEYNGGYVMPDLYNTGPITPKAKLVDFGEKYPEVKTDTTRYVIDAKSAEKYNYTFEGFKSTKQIIINGVSNVTIKDFFIEMGEIDFFAIRIADFNNVGQPKNILITDGEITGSKSAVFMGDEYTARRIYVHDYYGDAFKVGNNQVIESCYIGSGGIKEGAHADGFQVSFQSSNYKLLGNRFDMLQISGKYRANANLFLSLEKEYSDNATFNYNWLNGGGYTMYLFEYEDNKYTNVSFKNNIFGNGYRFKPINSNMQDKVKGFDTFIYAEEEDVPFIGSVVFYNQNGSRISDLKNTKGKIKILANAANYTPNEQNITLVAKLYNYKDELVKTYKQNNTIIRNMNGKEYLKSNGEVIKQVTLNDFPQNVATTLEINDLPSNLDGYYIKVEVYKEGINNKTLRTSKITNSRKREYKLKDLQVEVIKSEYEIAEEVTKDNFKVTALYTDDTKKVITNYTISPQIIKEDTKTITISYNENGVKVNKEIDIKIKEDIPEIKEDMTEENNDIESKNKEEKKNILTTIRNFINEVINQFKNGNLLIIGICIVIVIIILGKNEKR